MLSAAILAELRDAVGADGLIIERNQLQTYECRCARERCEASRRRSFCLAPLLQLQTVIRICARHHIPFVGRGAGTGLSGGAMPDDRGIVISCSRMTHILGVDMPNHAITVEAASSMRPLPNAWRRMVTFYLRRIPLRKRVGYDRRQL